MFRVGPAEPIVEAVDLDPLRSARSGPRRRPPRRALRPGGAPASAPAPRAALRERLPPSPCGGKRPPPQGSRCAAGTRRTTPATPRSGRRTGSAGAHAPRGTHGRPSGRGSDAARSATPRRSRPTDSRELGGLGRSGRRGRGHSCAPGTWLRTGARSGSPSCAAQSTARSESTASMTARTSSILVSSVGTWRTGSERPLPRLSNRRTRADSASVSTWSTKRGMSQPASRSRACRG